MKKIILIFVLTLVPFFAFAQEQESDTTANIPAMVDSTLYGKSIFDILPSREKGDDVYVKVHQSQAIANAFAAQINENGTRLMQGYRIRIFFDNKQTARDASSSVLSGFKSSHPYISAYRSYQTPFFKVTVGDFRTKSEAVRLLNDIKGEYPSAFIVKENINYPVRYQKSSSFEL